MRLESCGKEVDTPCHRNFERQEVGWLREIMRMFTCVFQNSSRLTKKYYLDHCLRFLLNTVTRMHSWHRYTNAFLQDNVYNFDEVNFSTIIWICKISQAFSEKGFKNCKKHETKQTSHFSRPYHNLPDLPSPVSLSSIIISYRSGSPCAGNIGDGWPGKATSVLGSLCVVV